MAGLDLITAAASEPLTTAAAKAHARIDTSADDAEVDIYVAAARRACESFLKKALIATVYDKRLDWYFPAEIVLPLGPVLDGSPPGVSSVTYIDDAGVSQTLSASDYQVSYGETCRIRPAYGLTWPSTRPVYDAVTVRFTAGGADAAAIDPVILQAVKMTFADFYDQRESLIVGTIASEIPQSAAMLMLPHVRHA